MKQPILDDPSRVTVSVIVPTTCEASRASLIFRAIESICSQSHWVTLEILIIVNGDRYDSSVVHTLEANRRLQVIRLKEGNVSAARYEGVCRAKGDFFCFLDDDDQFLPDALSIRVNLFSKHPEADVVATNGFVSIDGADKPLVDAGMEKAILTNPGHSFLLQNWFASPASLFRAKSIDRGMFNFSYKYFEWSYLFFLLLSSGKKVYFDQVLTYRKYEDNPLSISKSIEYAMAYPEFLLTLAALPLDRNVQRAIRRKYVGALNTQANIELTRGRRWQAWRAHLKCLANGGLRYTLFTRHLIFP